MCQAPQRGCIFAGPEMEKHVSGATYAGPCRAWLALLAWLGRSQPASAKLTSRLPGAPR